MHSCWNIGDDDEVKSVLSSTEKIGGMLEKCAIAGNVPFKWSLAMDSMEVTSLMRLPSNLRARSIPTSEWGLHLDLDQFDFVEGNSSMAAKLCADFL